MSEHVFASVPVHACASERVRLCVGAGVCGITGDVWVREYGVRG